MSADGDTRPGFHRRRSSRPQAESHIDELPEPIIDPPPNRVAIDALQVHLSELHRDMRSMRVEMVHRSDAEREAIYDLQHDVTRLDAAVTGLGTRVDDALEKQRHQQRLQFWLSVLGTVMLAALLVLFVLRIYGMAGV